MNKPASIALFYSVLVSAGFVAGFITSHWVRGPEVDQAALIDRHVFSNDYAQRMERWIAASSKVKMLTAISEGESADGFLVFALDKLEATIAEMRDWEARAPNDEFRALMQEDIQYAEDVYQQAKHNK